MIIIERKKLRWPHYTGFVIGMWIVISLSFVAYSYYEKLVSDTRGTEPKIGSQAPDTKKEIIYGLPGRLMIPELSVDAQIKHMGVNREGDMAVPEDIADTGWYKQGPHPGNKGSAVITGHIIGLKGEAGVFSKLHMLAVGDSFSVVDENKQTASFIVRKIQRYTSEQSAPEVFTSNDGAHLNLVTCIGKWDKERRQFQERLVLFTDLMM